MFTSIREATRATRSHTALRSIVRAVLFSIVAFTAFPPLPRASQMVGAARPNLERKGHAAVRLATGKVLVVGGENRNGPISHSEVFDPATGVFLFSADSLTARRDLTATLLPDGRAFVVGGRSGESALSSTELYDSAAQVFSSGPALRHARFGHTATLLPGGKLLVIGGDVDGSVEIFDPKTGLFSESEARLATPRRFHATALLRDGKVLVAGGTGMGGAVLDSAEILDLETLSFSQTKSPLLAYRSGLTVNALPDGKIQLIGGDANATMELFNPEGEYFSSKAHLLRTPGGIPVVLKTPGRAAILGRMSGLGLFSEGSPTEKLLDRKGYSLTVLPEVGQALAIGGSSTAGLVHTTAALFDASAATVTTDKSDYKPGERVVITGTGWLPLETVTLNIHRDTNEPPDTVLTAVADALGNISNSEYIVQEYDLGVTFLLTATGQTSGFTAQTSFTDGTLKVQSNAAGITFNLPWNIYTGGTCAGSPTSTATQNNIGFSGGAIWNKGVGNTDSIKLSAPAFSNQGGAFTGWTSTSPFVPPYTSPANDICITGNFSGNHEIIANFGAAAATTTTLTSSLNPSTYGDSVSFTATVARSTTPPTGIPTGTVQFKIDGVNFGSAVTLAAPTTLNSATAVSGSISTLTVPSHTITAEYTGNLAASTGTLTQTVNKATPTVSVTGGTFTYDGASHAATGFAYGVGGIGDVLTPAVTFSYVGTGSTSYGPTPTAPTNAGTYQVTANFAGNTNYTTASNTASLTITTKAASVTPAANTKVYGSADPTFTGTLSGFLAGDGVTATYARTAGETVLGSPYTISATLAPVGVLSNYNITYNTANFTITPKPASVTTNSASKVYGDADPTLTGALSGFLAADGVTASYSRATGENASPPTYHITATLSSTSPGALDNYTITNDGAEFTIDKRAATWTTTAASKTYGDADPSPLTTGSGTNFVAADGITATYTRVTGENASPPTYHITATLAPAAALSNYVITNDGNEFTIDKASTTTAITSDSPDPSVITGPVTINYSVTVVAPGAGTTPGNVTVTATTGETCTGTVAAGTCSITFTSAGTRNLTANYPGNSNFNGSTSAPQPHQVNTRTTTTAITFNPPGAITEGQSKTVVVTVTDVEVAGTKSNPSGIVTVTSSDVTDTFSFSTCSLLPVNGDKGQCSVTVTTADDGAHTITGSYPDSTVHTASSGGALLSVSNVAPTIVTFISTDYNMQTPGSATVTGMFTDPGTADTHSCTVDWDDGLGTIPGTVVESGGSNRCDSSKEFTATGIHTVRMTICDDDGACNFKELMITAYDMNGGFVTGGGWIDSPTGASTAYPLATGKANFGFVSKYKKGSNVPEGHTEFQFKAGNLNFHSSSYHAETLVVSGHKAQYRGIGTINGSGPYQFILTAYDGQANGGGGVDKFRMKIIGVYDNRMNPSDDIDFDPQELGGGSIVIHKGK